MAQRLGQGLVITALVVGAWVATSLEVRPSVPLAPGGHDLRAEALIAIALAQQGSLIR